MSKAILEFSLPEEENEHLLAVHGLDFALVVFDLDQLLRGWVKYGHQFESISEALEKARESIYDLMEDRGISLDMVA